MSLGIGIGLSKGKGSAFDGEWNSLDTGQGVLEQQEKFHTESSDLFRTAPYQFADYSIDYVSVNLVFKNCWGVNILIPIYSFIALNALSPVIMTSAFKAIAHSINLSSSGSSLTAFIFGVLVVKIMLMPLAKNERALRFLFHLPSRFSAKRQHIHQREGGRGRGSGLSI